MNPVEQEVEGLLSHFSKSTVNTVIDTVGHLIHFVNLISDVLDHLKLNKDMCIGNATDGASNMQGQYKGFSALMASQSPSHVHVWCYAHVLNLVLSDTTQTVIESGTPFSLLNDIAVFINT